MTDMVRIEVTCFDGASVLYRDAFARLFPGAAAVSIDSDYISRTRTRYTVCLDIPRHHFEDRLALLAMCCDRHCSDQSSGAPSTSV
jgi:hypothetical protein